MLELELVSEFHQQADKHLTQPNYCCREHQKERNKGPPHDPTTSNKHDAKKQFAPDRRRHNRTRIATQSLTNARARGKTGKRVSPRSRARSQLSVCLTAPPVFVSRSSKKKQSCRGTKIRRTCTCPAELSRQCRTQTTTTNNNSFSHLSLDVELQALGDGPLALDVEAQHEEVLLPLAHVRADRLRADELVAELPPAEVGGRRRQG